MSDRLARFAIAPLYGILLAILIVAVRPTAPSSVIAKLDPPITPLFASPPSSGSFSGARLTNSQDEIGGILTFDTINFDRGYFHPPSELCVPRAGFYRSTLMVTTLGTLYGHQANTDVEIAIGIVGEIHGHIAFVRSHNPGTNAELTEAVSPPTYLGEGTCLEATVTTGLYIESNWLDRAGNLSPVFSIEWLGN